SARRMVTAFKTWTADPPYTFVVVLLWLHRGKSFDRCGPPRLKQADTIADIGLSSLWPSHVTPAPVVRCAADAALVGPNLIRKREGRCVMSTKISKRELFSKHALSAGLGVSALALLPQRPSADTPFTSFPFTATGAPTARTMPDRLGEIKNVKDYGAVGDSSTDDTATIQASRDAASTKGVPATLNTPVYSPAGNYHITYPIYIKNTGGAHVFGAGMQATTITNYGNTPVSFNGWVAAASPDINYTSVLTVTSPPSGTLHRGTIIDGAGLYPSGGIRNRDFLTGNGG